MKAHCLIETAPRKSESAVADLKEISYQGVKIISLERLYGAWNIVAVVEGDDLVAVNYWVRQRAGMVASVLKITTSIVIYRDGG